METLQEQMARLSKQQTPKETLEQQMARLAAKQSPAPAAPEPDEDTGYFGRLATHVLNTAQGIPGMEAFEAAAGALGSHLPGNVPVSYRDALEGLREQTGKIGGKTRAAEKIVGSLAVAPFLPGSAVTAGASLGAADQALAADPMSLGERAGRTALGAVTGAAIGGIAKGAGNLAQRSGLTDAVGAGLRKIVRPASSNLELYGVQQTGPSAAQQVGEAVGTTGAANRLLAARQSLLNDLSGSEQTAAQSMLDHVSSYKAQANKLYGLARQDTKAVSDPRVTEAMQDPRVQQMFQVVRERLGIGAPPVAEIAAGKSARVASGGVRSKLESIDDDALEAELERLHAAQSRDAQTLAAHQEHPEYHDAMELRQVGAKEDADGLVDPMLRSRLSMLQSQMDQRAKSLAKIEGEWNRRQALMRTAEHGDGAGDASFAFGDNTLPHPEEIAMAKRLLGSVIQQKFNAPQGISAAEAAQLAPKLDLLRSALHDASPAWKQADQFYAQAKNFETAYTKAFGAQQKATSGALDPKRLRTPEAIRNWTENATGTPTGIARASGVQAGTAGRLAEALRSAPLGTDMASTLQGANGVFQPSQAAASIRRPAFGSDDAAQAFASKVGKASVPESFGAQSASPVKPWQWVTQQNPLATAKGTELRSVIAAQLEGDQRTGSNVIEQSLKNSDHGKRLLQLFQRAGFLGGNAMQPFR